MGFLFKKIVEQNFYSEAKMSRLQTLIFRGITGAMRTTPTAAVGFIVCEEPIYIATIAEAVQTMGRLTAMGKWTRGAKHTRLLMGITELPTPSTKQDKTVKKYNFDKLFRTCTPNREAWEGEEGKALLQKELWFTDGFKGHSGIKGNEKADQLAKEGGAGKPIGQEPILGQAPCCTNKEHLVGVPLRFFSVSHML